jgi:hypothetical protein
MIFLFLDECKSCHDMQEVIAIFIIFYLFKTEKRKNKNKIEYAHKILLFINNHSLKPK